MSQDSLRELFQAVKGNPSLFEQLDRELGKVNGDLVAAARVLGFAISTEDLQECAKDGAGVVGDDELASVIGGTGAKAIAPTQTSSSAAAMRRWNSWVHEHVIVGNTGEGS